MGVDSVIEDVFTIGVGYAYNATDIKADARKTNVYGHNFFVYGEYQPNQFVSGVKIYTLRNKELNKYNALFICTLLNKEVYRYSYGRARILDKIKEEYIKLPTNSLGNPNWHSWKIILSLYLIAI